MSEVDAHSIGSDLTEELHPPDSDNADIKYYQTADELLRQKSYALDQKAKLSAAWESAGPEQRHTIDLEIERLMSRISVSHTMVRARYAEEGEALLRETRELRQGFEAEEDTNDSASTLDSDLDSNSQFFQGVCPECEE